MGKTLTGAKDCDVSRRTVFRDTESLRLAGVPIAFDGDHDRYSIPNAYFSPPIDFTPAEAISLVSLANELGRGDRLPFYEPAQATALKLQSSLQPVLREGLRVVWRAIRIQPMPVSPLENKQGICRQLVEARTSRHVVRIVLVRFKPLVARNVAEVIWHKTQQHEFEADGSLLFRAQVTGLNEIMWWILGYGDQAEVLEPAELRQMVARRVTSMASMYNNDGIPKASHS